MKRLIQILAGIAGIFGLVGMVLAVFGVSAALWKGTYAFAIPMLMAALFCTIPILAAYQSLWQHSLSSIKSFSATVMLFIFGIFANSSHVLIHSATSFGNQKEVSLLMNLAFFLIVILCYRFIVRFLARLTLDNVLQE